MVPYVGDARSVQLAAEMTTLLFGRRSTQFLNDAAMLPRLTALLALALGLLRIAALSLHPDKLIADAPFSLADEVE